jgi:hypothetical protein
MERYTPDVMPSACWYGVRSPQQLTEDIREGADRAQLDDSAELGVRVSFHTFCVYSTFDNVTYYHGVLRAK